MPAAVVAARHTLALEQVSALCLRGPELVAVGDEERVVLTAPLDALDAQRRHAPALGAGKSEWEAVAADAAGRVLVIEEEQATVTVLEPALRMPEHVIALRARDGPDARAAVLLDGDNRGPEGMVLLAGGHVLVVKQRSPVLLVEFGPRDDDPVGLVPATGAFPLAHAELHPLRSWLLRDEAAVGSANDLAFDAGGRLHAISSRSRCIYALGTEGDAAVAGLRWELPPAAGADDDRKAEGLAFAPDDRPLVALDVRDDGPNLLVLDPLA